MSTTPSFPRKGESSAFVRLGDVCRIQNGFAFDSACFTEAAGMPLIRIRDINKGKCSVHFDGEYAEDFIVVRGDVLIGMDGEFNIAEWCGEPALLNQRVCRLIADAEKLDSTFLVHRIKEDLRRIEDNTPSTTVKHLSSKQIANIEWELPHIEKQRRIAARLKAQLTEVDIARQAAQAQVRDADLLRQRLLRHTFDTLHDAPRKVLGDWATTTSGVTPSRSNDSYWNMPEIAWVKTGEINFAPIKAVQESISKRALAECSLSLLPPKTVLIAITGEGKTRGRSAVLEVPATTNQHSVAILPNEIWNAEFLQLWLQSSYHDLRELSEGRGGSRSALSGTQIKSLKVPSPDIDDQRRIVARLQAQLAEADGLAQAAATQLAEIECLPQRILARAFDASGSAA